jgi:hypothetical protein
MQCEFIESVVQWSPSNKLKKHVVRASPETYETVKVPCEAGIVCKKADICDDFCEVLEEAFKKCGIEISKVSGTISNKVLDRYRSEMHYGEEVFFLPHEKKKICPLYPLTTFPEKSNEN